jgi:hypothetical protein
VVHLFLDCESNWARTRDKCRSDLANYIRDCDRRKPVHGKDERIASYGSDDDGLIGYVRQKESSLPQLGDSKTSMSATICSDARDSDDDGDGVDEADEPGVNERTEMKTRLTLSVPLAVRQGIISERKRFQQRLSARFATGTTGTASSASLVDNGGSRTVHNSQ